MSNQKLNKLKSDLEGNLLSAGSAFAIEMFDGEYAVLKITVEGREELPIYMTADENHILCISYLWSEQEVDQGKRIELLETLLKLNVTIPLSAFSKIHNQYILFGSLSPDSSVKDLLREIEVLSDNTLDAIEAVSDYLNGGLKP